MNRATRRAAAKQSPSWMPPSQEERIRRLMKNGISPADLERESEKAYKAGFDAGFKAAGEPVVKTCYAAVCLAAHETFRFGRKRCLRLLQALDRHVVNTLTSAEAIDEACEKVGIRINFTEPFERVEEI